MIVAVKAFYPLRLYVARRCISKQSRLFSSSEDILYALGLLLEERG
ncbi:hypothetical protein HMPREF3201_02393 [Megasphaera sp. MJR8396C]|nr:hypothetical protein HMPREF3201_02393 [Megasphaera sp. MJR8396C]